MIMKQERIRQIIEVINEELDMLHAYDEDCISIESVITMLELLKKGIVELVDDEPDNLNTGRKALSELSNNSLVHDTKFIQHMIREEGKINQVYSCSGGFKTIGIGHKLMLSEISSGYITLRDGVRIRYAKRKLTDNEVMSILANDLMNVQKCLEDKITVPLKPCEYKALVSFVFNIGWQAFSNSTMRSLINQRKYDLAVYGFKRWVYAAGKKLGGLVRRREREEAMWFGE